MKLQEFVAQSGEIVNELSAAIENEQMGLKEVEERILQFLNRIGGLMVQEVVERVGEPFIENRVWVEGEEVIFDQVRTLRFSISSTAVQWNAEHAGGQLADDPHWVIEEKWRRSGRWPDTEPWKPSDCIWVAPD